MTYNLHPIFVHFPIAFFLVYSIIKILPLYKWFPKIHWKHIEQILLLVGVFGALAALFTGEIAEKIIKTDHDLVEMHSLFAGVATWIYIILLLGELLPIINKYLVNKNLLSFKFGVDVLRKIESIINQRYVGAIISFLGLVTISIAGLLGGVIVYGTSADPLASVILKILGL